MQIVCPKGLVFASVGYKCQAPVDGFQIVDLVAIGIFLGEESVLVNGNGFGDIMDRKSFVEMSGLFEPNQIVEVSREPVAKALFALYAYTWAAVAFSQKMRVRFITRGFAVGNSTLDTNPSISQRTGMIVLGSPLDRAPNSSFTVGSA